MSENVIRQDVIELGFDADMQLLRDMLDELKNIKKAVGGIGDEDGMDELKKETKEANSAADKLNRGLKKVCSSLGTVAKKAAKLTFKGLTVGIGAATTAIGALAKKSVAAYGEYEQLVGGVKTLFGAKETDSVEEYAKLVGKSVSEVKGKYKELKEVEKLVVKDANNAYKTAGLSANDYMSTVTTFSASLIQSLNGDTKKAAKLSNQAIIDMSDNANKMGTDMGMIQNAYAGFAKQNYTMLDNLKLGYGGTKSEMERLLKDAGKLAGKTYKISSYADVIEAIHQIQNNIGITGTTAKEADKTIQGSLNSFRSAWQNLMPALIQGDEEFEQCLDNLIESAGTFGKNIMPAIEKSLIGIGKLVEKASPMIEKYLPKIVEDLLPPMIKAGTSLFIALAKSIPTMAKIVIKELPNIAKEIWNGITDAFGETSTSKNTAGKIAKTISGVLGGGVIAGFAAFKGMKAFRSIQSVFSSMGGAASGAQSAAKPLSGLAGTNTKVILKGMANLAIIIGGLTAIAAALAFVAPKIAALTDAKSFLKLIGAIGMLGTVGSVMAKFAAIVGVIPITVVLKGLANIGLALGGMTAIVAAFGALSKIPKFNEFIESGGDTLATLFKQIGKIGGAIIGGLGEGVSASLPNIGKNLSAFATSIKPMFTAFSGVDTASIGTFFKALGSFLVSMAANNVLSFFGGKTELPKLGAELTGFANNSSGFFTKVNAIPAESFPKAKSLFNCLAGMKGLPKEGGVLSWFTGNINYDNIASGLGKLSSEKVTGFFNAIKEIPQAGFDNATKLFNALANMKSLPKEGGVKGWFSGNVNYDNIASGLGKMSGKGVKGFFAMVGGFSEQTFTNTSKLFETLSGIKSLPKEGGFWQNLGDRVTGKETKSALSVIAGDLEKFSEKTKAFFSQINKLDLSKLNGLWASLKKPGTITKKVSSVVGEGIKDIVKKVSKLPVKMGDAIKKASSSFSTAVASMWKDAVKASVSPANKLIGGANHVLKQFGADQKLVEWTPYARGTNGHKGGNALVNDGRGAELVQMPNGNTFIPKGRNVFLPNAPKGMAVLDAQKTAQLMGKAAPTFNYAKGTGEFDVFTYENGKSLVNALEKDRVGYDGMSGYVLNLGKSMISTFKGAMNGWADKLIEKYGAKGLGSYVPGAGVKQWRSTVIRALKMENQYSAANVKRTLFQMKTESGGNPRAINLWDSNAKKGTPSKGLMQVIDPTFKSYAKSGYNKNIYDPLSNILASVRYAVSRYGSLSRAYQGHGYSGGTGTVSLPQRSPSMDISSGRTIVTENNSYAPVFNLTISGTTDDRATAAKVKRWVQEAMNECFEQLARNNCEAY